MSKRKLLLCNTFAGISKQLITITCGFILPRFILLSYGSEINGLVSSLSHFLGFITLLEFGIGPVIQSNLYKPLAYRDYDTISKIVISSERFYRRLASLFLVYVLVLFLVYPSVINGGYDILFSGALLLVIGFSTFVQYYFGATYQLLLNADQKGYIQLGLQSITVILNTVISIVLIKCGATIHVVKLFAAVVYLIRPICQAVYVRKHYYIDRNIKIEEEPIKQKWNGFAQHIAGAVCGSTDHMVLTFFSSLANVSVYTIYQNVVLGMTNLVITMATGIEAMWGNMIAKEEYSRLQHSFAKVEFITHAIVSFSFSVMAITLVPFVRVYTNGINDVNYVAPAFAYILVAAYAVQAMRVPYTRLIHASRRFKETQLGAIASMLLNVVITVVLVLRYGLIGTAIGTFVAMFYHLGYFVLYLRKNIISISIYSFAKYICADGAIALVSFYLSRNLQMAHLSYGAWVWYAMQVSSVTFVCTVTIHTLAHLEVALDLLRKIWERLR